MSWFGFGTTSIPRSVNPYANEGATTLVTQQLLQVTDTQLGWLEVLIAPRGGGDTGAAGIKHQGGDEESQFIVPLMGKGWDGAHSWFRGKPWATASGLL